MRQTVYEEMEVDAEMQRGLLPGALALSAKFVPALRAVAYRTVEVRAPATICATRSHSCKGTYVQGAWLRGADCRTLSAQRALHSIGHITGHECRACQVGGSQVSALLDVGLLSEPSA